MAKTPNVTAARRVEKLYIENQDNPRYRRNMLGEGMGPATGNIEPMRKIANARNIAQVADTAEYKASIAKRRGK